MTITTFCLFLCLVCFGLLFLAGYLLGRDKTREEIINVLYEYGVKEDDSKKKSIFITAD